MALSLIDIMALIFVIIASIKLVVLFINPKSWQKVVNSVYGNTALTNVISIILAGIFLYILLQELTIVQITAVMLFMAPLMALGIIAYSKEMITLSNKLLSDKDVLKRAWLPLFIWVILIFWVIYVLFA